MNLELKEFLSTKVSAIYEKIKGYREHLHQNPELSYKEFNTMEYVAAKLKEIGIPMKKVLLELELLALFVLLNIQKIKLA